MEDVLQLEAGLMHFLTASEEKLHILVVESAEYLSKLRELFPQAVICAVGADGDIMDRPEYAGLRLQWVTADYLSERLPLPEASFDYVIAEHCLDNADNPQDIASGLGLYLKDTGYLIMSFMNVRYWKVIRNLMEGHFYHICSRIFSKDEMMKLLAASFYKDVVFAPQYGGKAPEGFIDQLEGVGFENYSRDLEVEVWMLQAAKSMPEILELKRMYTPELRRQLVTLLRRLEYGIDAGVNWTALWQLCQESFVYPAYLASFIKETIVHVNDFLWQLLPELETDEQKLFGQELLEELLVAYQENEHEDLWLLEAWAKGQPEPAYAYPGAEAQPVGCLWGAAAAARDEAGRQKAILYPELAGEQKVAFITCVNKPELYAEAVLYLSQLKLPQGFGAELVPVYGAQSMCQGYNWAMQQTTAKYKVYVHQDALIVNKDFIYDILAIFQDAEVGGLGIIGARRLPKSGVWWDGLRTYGRVLHACEAESTVDTVCMEPPEPYMEVEAVDGLMMATQVDTAWREDLFDGWHFYEISQGKELQRRGYKVVVPHQRRFWCIHSPKEKPLEKSYKRYQKKFLKEYGQELDPEV